MSILLDTLKAVAFRGGNTLGFTPNHSNHQVFGLNQGFNPTSNLDIDDDVFINEGYAQNTHLYSIHNIITNASNNLRYKVCINTIDGKIEDVESQLYQLITNPNPNQTHEEWREELLKFGMLTGDFFLYGLKPIGFGDRIAELSNLAPNITDVLVNANSNSVVGYQTTLNNKVTRYELEEVWHGKLFNPTRTGLTNHRGMSPLQAGYRSLVADNELVTAEASFYRNKGASGILSSASDIMALGEKDADLLDQAIVRKMGGAEKSNGIITTGARVNFMPIGMSPSDLDMIKSGDVKLRNLCMIYGVDSKLLGDPKASTYNNVNEVTKQLYTNAVIPYNARIISYLNRFVVPAYSKADNVEYSIELDTSNVEVLQKDQKAKAEKNKIVIDGVVALVNSSLSTEAKVSMLMNLYDIDENEAQTIANGTAEEQSVDGQGSGTAETNG